MEMRWDRKVGMGESRPSAGWSSSAGTATSNTSGSINSPLSRLVSVSMAFISAEALSAMARRLLPMPPGVQTMMKAPRSTNGGKSLEMSR
eukprot:4670718-Prymnesium_polylepis.1